MPIIVRKTPITGNTTTAPCGKTNGAKIKTLAKSTKFWGRAKAVKRFPGHAAAIFPGPPYP